MHAPLVLSRAQRFARLKDFQCALISTMQHLSEPVKPCDLICACSSGPLQGAEVCAIKRFSVCCHFSCGTQRVLKFLLALLEYYAVAERRVASRRLFTSLLCVLEYGAVAKRRVAQRRLPLWREDVEDLYKWMYRFGMRHVA